MSGAAQRHVHQHDAQRAPGPGLTFVRKDDHDLHVYGTGNDRRVIISWHKDQPAHRDDAAPGTARTGGTSAS
jgi:hypothetical protein